MKIKLRGGKPCSVAAIAALENTLGYYISDGVKRFLASNNGAKPESNVFEVGDQNSSDVNEFISVDAIPKELAQLEGLREKMYPIASDSSGNYVVIDEGDGGAVFFWDHELHDPLTKIAGNFESFLESLEPFDQSSVELKPGQVISSWIDPEFLKQIQDAESEDEPKSTGSKWSRFFKR